MNKVISGVVGYVKNFWSCLVNIGINEIAEPDDIRYLRFVNVVAVLTAFAIVGYIPGSIIHKDYIILGVQLADLICVLSVLWLNHLGYHKVARQTYLVVVNVFVLLNACIMGVHSGVQDMFYFTYVLPFLLFRVKEFKNIAAGIIMAVAAYSVFQIIYPYFSIYNLSVSDQLAIQSVNVWMKFVLFGIAIYILAYYNHTSETELASINGKLQEQAVELKRSNEDLEQFAYIISHDLKAPVRNISSFMKLLANRYSAALPPDGKEFVNMAQISSERLGRQIDDMLSYCRVNRNLPPATDVNLNELIQTITMEMGNKITETGASIKVEKGLPLLKGVHATMIYHIFQNLIANGIKFNTNANPEILIDYADNGDNVTFSVTDNGIGIENGFESKLFQMFKRLHTQDQFEGTGIGLALCKKIVNFYKGEIWYQSQAGKGTTFYFTLPKEMVGPAMPKLSDFLARTEFVSKAA